MESGGAIVVGDINQLPVDCLSHVIALTSSRDACASSAVSTAFHSAANSDDTWQRFLPPDYAYMLSRAVYPVEYASKKELFFRLCDRPVLIDGGKLSFGLDRWTGKKSFMVSARALWIVWGSDERYWCWMPVPDSRFSEAIGLIDVCWLEIRGKMSTKLLSPQTPYSVYLIFKLADTARGLGTPSQETAITVGEETVSRKSVCLQPTDRGRRRLLRGQFRLWGGLGLDAGMGMANEIDKDAMLPQKWESEGERDDGWLEIEMGEFYNSNGEDGDVEMSFMEVKGGHWKRGLILHGIEIRPKH
ncbi:hypothetical protein LUZ61_020677 [Rhynchospora tenuis]|uniref:F-box domain-containing protein n=1 Tax=Rhynchospora tenuis TaxID=198213 RepID=A0AAD5ZDG4_9POAL|nr:hypothetical protein LUZ61_020677 [Rhynchospora tenuis]